MELDTPGVARYGRKYKDRMYINTKTNRLLYLRHHPPPVQLVKLLEEVHEPERGGGGGVFWLAWSRPRLGLLARWCIEVVTSPPAASAAMCICTCEPFLNLLLSCTCVCMHKGLTAFLYVCTYPSCVPHLVLYHTGEKFFSKLKHPL